MLHPIDEVWSEFPSLVLKDGAASAVVHGADLASGGIRSIPRPFAKDARVVLVSGRGEILAFGTALFASEEIPHQPHGWVVDSERVLADTARFPPAWGERRPSKGPTPVDSLPEGQG
ncbi:MAG: hypothetical protein L3J96_03075 [Thermoplasmata archaeon]|nr:hypothetical protein [Thermoplasmata archaeon]